MVGKIKAAVDTRQDSLMVIIARSDARAIEGLEAAIDRVNAYLEAGADVGFVEAPQTVEELRIVGQKVRGPALVNVFEGGKTPMLGAKELEAMGFRLGIYVFLAPYLLRPRLRFATPEESSAPRTMW